MRLCFVIPQVFLSKIDSVVRNEYPSIEPDYIIYEDYRDTPGLLLGRQHEYDAIIFGGQSPLEICEQALSQEVYWSHIPKTGSTLLRALLEATLRGWDITRLSIDTYDEPLLIETYAEFGIERNRLNVHIFEGDRTDPAYIGNANDFHKKNLRSGAVSGCITALHAVSRDMEQADLPYILTHPTVNILREKISEALQIYRAKCNARGQIVVVMVHIDYPSDYAASMESEYHFMLEKSQVSQQIYRYAEQISASVAEGDTREYILFTTKDVIEAETHSYQRLRLIQWVEKVTMHTVSVGIGHGETVAQARQNAMKAMLRAKKKSASVAYALLADGKYIGPLRKGAEKEIDSRQDDKLLLAAAESGLNTETICRLYAFLVERQTNVITSDELAQGLRISKRSADRLIAKLEGSGRAIVEGAYSLGRRGRPSRVIKIKLFPE